MSLFCALAPHPLIRWGDDAGTYAAPADERVAVRANPRKSPPAGVLGAIGEKLTVEAVFTLHADLPSFGGLSGLWIAPDGTHMVAVSDIGQRWQASLTHGERGRLLSLQDWSVADLPPGPGDRTRPSWRDAEALAGFGPNGLVVAFEGEHRLRRWALDDLDAPPERLPLPHGLGGPSNSGIEALAGLSEGRLFALAERVGAWGGEGLMGWMIDGETAEDFVYIPGPGFAPTGAARLEKTIYIVERQFSLLGGFRSRIITLPIGIIRPGARLEGTELAAFRWGDIGQNFEGIAARRGPDGRIFLYLLADDNFSFLQQTLLVQLSLSAYGVAWPHH